MTSVRFVVSSKRRLPAVIVLALTYKPHCRCNLREREALRLLAAENCVTRI